jgi:hypothetical protein
MSRSKSENRRRSLAVLNMIVDQIRAELKSKKGTATSQQRRNFRAQIAKFQKKIRVYEK